jgi:hypothetical protein
MARLFEAWSSGAEGTNEACGADEVKSGLAAFIFFGKEKAQTENGYKNSGPARLWTVAER